MSTRNAKGKSARRLLPAGSLIISALAICGESRAGGWSQQTGGNGVDLFAIDMLDAERGMIAGAGGTIVRTTNGGGMWGLQFSGTSSDLFGISGLGSGIGVAVGAAGAITRTTDAGATWSVIRGDQTETLRGVHLLDSGYGIAGGYDADGLLFAGVTGDGGLNWGFTSFLVDGAEGSITGVAAVNPLLAFASASLSDGRGAVLRSTDGGQNWSASLFTASSVLAIDFPTASVGYATGFSGLVHRTTDGGANWTTLSNGSGQPGFGVSFADAATGWVVGAYSTVRRTTDSGLTWEDQSPGGLDLYSVDFATPTVGGISGIYARILRTESAGLDPTAAGALPAERGGLVSSSAPNPFDRETVLSFELNRGAAVEIEVFDAAGRSVLRESIGVLAPGAHRWRWDGSDGSGAPVARGAYLCRVRAGANGEGTVKLLLLRD
jgi:photosystem II stability/assembly factor-like uncharacterized protein